MKEALKYLWMPGSLILSELLQRCARIEKIEEMLRASDDITRQAYSMMSLDKKHKWMSRTAHEVDYILDKTPLSQGTRILDVGCGTGRHSAEFARRGFHVTAIDYLEFNDRQQGDYRFLKMDFRNEGLNEKFDLIVALYDVIGTFPDAASNLAIIKNIHNHLMDGGTAIVSVMNMDYILSRNPKRFSLKKNPDAIFEIRVSENMQQTGEVFDTNALLVDAEEGIVYRKEMFNRNPSAHALPEELLVRDKRYAKIEIETIFSANGFDIMESKYAKLGKWDHPVASEDSKEILLVLGKNVQGHTTKQES
jgi:2-polyprenyl-3-methyl-5-hydroxy-6-metoxy-1,4-benzoquinol methylase